MSFASAQLTGFNFEPQISSTTTPVPILRYVDTQNPDGSYTYGYENGDGTYKIETRYATGEVKGKYGYYDDLGTFREVEYGATPTGGFEPSGNGIELPQQPQEIQRSAQPQNEPQNERRVKVVRRKRPQQPQESQFENFENVEDRRVFLPITRRNQKTQTTTQRPILRQPQQPSRPVVRQQRPAQPQQPAFVPQQQNSVRFDGHPAANIDLNTGSYTIFYSGK